LGGGFGRKFEIDFIVQAVMIAKSVAKPVKLIWAREEDIQHDFYRPASTARLRAGLDAAGKVTAWDFKIVAPSIMTRAFPRAVKNGIDLNSVGRRRRVAICPAGPAYRICIEGRRRPGRLLALRRQQHYQLLRRGFY
jgi:hypothetical protein